MNSLTAYETQLRQDVLGVTLLGELPYDERDLIELRALLRGLGGGSAVTSLRRVAGRYDLPILIT